MFLDSDSDLAYDEEGGSDYVSSGGEGEGAAVAAAIAKRLQKEKQEVVRGLFKMLSREQEKSSIVSVGLEWSCGGGFLL